MVDGNGGDKLIEEEDSTCFLCALAGDKQVGQVHKPNKEM
jgi:hypothetical protein